MAAVVDGHYSQITVVIDMSLDSATGRKIMCNMRHLAKRAEYDGRFMMLLNSVGCQQACTPAFHATDNFEAALSDDFTDTHDTETHCCGPLMFQSKHSNAKLLFAERLTNSFATNQRFSLCCGDNKVKLWTTPDLPEPLATLLVDTAACC